MQQLIRLKRSSDRYRANKMANALLLNNQRQFRNGVRKVKHSNKQLLVNTVDTVTGDCEIADLFASKYESLYKSVSYDEVDMHMFCKQILCSCK